MRRSQTWTLGLISLVLGMVLAGGAVAPRQATAAPPPGTTGASHGLPPGVQLRDGTLVIQLHPGASPNDLAGVLTAYDARIDRSMAHGRLIRVRLADGGDLAALLLALQANPSVARAGADHVVRAFDVPNDPGYSHQWDLHAGDGGTNVEGAWDLTTNRGAGVTVAVIDTGVAHEDYTGGQAVFGPKVFKRAPDLAGVPVVAPWNWITENAHANDENGHGTHVAGTILQARNNGMAEAGISAASLMPLRILDYAGNGAGSDLIDAIYYAADNGAKVINMSLGFSGTGTPDANGNVCGEIVGLADALDYADAMGVTVVAASGNDGVGTVACPAAYPTVIAVGATRYDGSVSFYSNGGSALSVTAPGGDPNVDQNNDGAADQITQQTYCLDAFTLITTGQFTQFCSMPFSGTSMASPHVAAVATLLIGQLSTLSPAQVRGVLEATARDRGQAGWDAQYGWGAIDAQAALASVIANPPPPPPPGPAPKPRPVVEPGATNLAASVLGATAIRLNWTDNATGETGFRIERSIDGGVTWTQAGLVAAGTTQFTNYSLTAGTEYSYRVRSYDSMGNSPWSSVVTASTFPAPSAPTALSGTVLSATSIRLNWTDTSSTEQGFKVERSTDGLNFSVVIYAGANVTAATSSSLAPSTAYWFRLYAYDGTVNSDRSNTVQVTTLDLPTPPVDLAATPVSTTSIKLTWTDTSTTEQGFKVERSGDGGSTWAQAAVVTANSVSWTNNGLVTDSPYWYRVSGYDGTLSGAPSNVATATTLAPPSAPANLAATAIDTTTIRLNWTDTSGWETGFRIERSGDGGATWAQIATAAANSATYTSSGLTPSTTYSFRVRAYEGTTNGAYSNVATASTVDAPAPPANLAGQAMSTTSIKLTWTNVSTTQTWVKVERSIDGVTWAQVANLSGKSTTWTNSSLAAGAQYRYRVRAAAGTTNGQYSAAITVSTLAPPSAPMNLVATAVTAKSVKLTWTDTSSYESGFRVERSLDGVTWIAVATLAANTGSWTNSSLTAHTTYHYRVRAYEGVTNGSFSNVATATTP